MWVVDLIKSSPQEHNLNWSGLWFLWEGMERIVFAFIHSIWIRNTKLKTTMFIKFFRACFTRETLNNGKAKIFIEVRTIRWEILGICWPVWESRQFLICISGLVLLIGKMGLSADSRGKEVHCKRERVECWSCNRRYLLPRVELWSSWYFVVFNQIENL